MDAKSVRESMRADIERINEKNKLERKIETFPMVETDIRDEFGQVVRHEISVKELKLNLRGDSKQELRMQAKQAIRMHFFTENKKITGKN